MVLELARYTFWRDREEPYDDLYASITDERLRSLVTYFTHSQPAEWSFSKEARDLYEKIYGAEARKKLEQTGNVCENISPVWVVGTLVTEPGQTELSEGLKRKAAGEIFGHDPVYIEVDYTNKVKVVTPFGTTWVDEDQVKVSSMKVSDLMAKIRGAVKDALSQ